MKRENKVAVGILVIGILVLAGYWFMPQSSEVTQTEKPSIPVEERVILPQYEKSIYQNIPEVQNYLADIRKMIQKGQAILPLQRSELDSNAQKVQALLLADPEFTKDTIHGKKLLHNDMMRILPAIISSLDEKSRNICQSHTCYQAEKYNFVTNTTTRAIVDTDTLKVLSVERYSGCSLISLCV